MESEILRDVDYMSIGERAASCLYVLILISMRENSIIRKVCTAH